jgi:hypothetical protein
MIRLMPLRPFRLLFAFILTFLGLVPALAATSAVAGWQAVLVAGDNAQPVFDNAITAMDRWLRSQGVPQSNIHRLSAQPADSSVEPAAARRIVDRIAGLQPRPGEGCFIYITSHGSHDDGVYLAYNQEFLWPASLAQALAVGCGDAPTVVIVSSCFSGSFTSGSMREPNRILLSAARADRPSFGCQADRTYTVFDECLLAALPRAANWETVYRDDHACVRDRERRLHVLPSHPQAFFGAAVRSLSVR